MDVVHAIEFDSPVGSLRIASTAQGLAYVELPHASGRGFDGWRTRHATEAVVKQGFEPNRVYIAQIQEFLAGKREVFELPIDLRATPFQRAVYEELLRIPFGETRTYAQIARALGRPAATRAVGAANGANPISLVVPCHRVIGSSGHLQGYAGGLELKGWLLAMEQGRGGQAGLLF
jgi:O-6-methylguanine DNA methyltransferase